MVTPGPHLFKGDVLICGVQKESTDGECLGMETCTEHLPEIFLHFHISFCLFSLSV